MQGTTYIHYYYQQKHVLNDTSLSTDTKYLALYFEGPRSTVGMQYHQ